MEHKTSFSNIYITLITSDNEEGEEEYNSNDETKSYQQWDEPYTTIELLNIVGIVQEITPTDNPISSTEKPTQYYVEMFHSLIARPLESNEPITNLIGIIKVNLRNLMNLQSTLQILVDSCNHKCKIHLM
jgi:hypothetical protein